MTQRLSRSVLLLTASLPLLAALAGIQSNAQAATIAAPAGFSVSVFATTGGSTLSAPDSIIVDGQSVYVGYGNGTASDGTDGLPTQLVQYSAIGQLEQTFSLPGHIDGLRADSQNGLLYALLNQDGSPLLTTVNPLSGAEQTYNLPALAGRGYDDLRFVNGKAYVSITNPVDSTSPILGQLVKSGDAFDVKPLLAAGAVTDPDSLGVTPQGDLLLSAQADQQFVTIQDPGTVKQTVSVVSHTGTTVDDTVFAPKTPSNLLVADTKNNAIYAISGDFTAGSAFSAVSDLGFIGLSNLQTGDITPFVTGLGSPHGLAFQSTGVPEPSDIAGSLAFGLVLGGLALKRHKQQKQRSQTLS